MTFKEWLKACECTVTGKGCCVTVGSRTLCLKDSDNPNFQLQGAMSDIWPPKVSGTACNNEMCGGGFIVGAPPKKHPDFQIWGAMSDLKNKRKMRRK